MTKKQFIQSFVFLCGFIAFFAIMNLVYKSTRSTAEGGYWQYFYQVMPSDSQDIVFMGDSHAQCSFIPEVIDDILGTQSVILITPGTGIYQKYFEFEEVIKSQPNALIVLETNGVFGGENQVNLKPRDYAFFDSMPFSIEKAKYIYGFSSPSNYLTYVFPYLTYHQEWKTPNKVLKKISQFFLDVEAPELSNNGYEELLTPMTYSDYKRLYHNLTDDSAGVCKAMDLENRFGILDKMVASSLEMNGKFILMKAPVFVDRYRSCEDDLLMHINDNNVAYYSLLDQDYYSRLWFADEVHTTTFGAFYVTLEAIPMLAEHLGLEIDEFKYEYYRSYLFKDIDTKYNGTHIYVELTPEDELLSKDLLYKWEIKQDDTIVKIVDYQQDRFINFETNNDFKAEYEIHVWINNPDGDFVLEGIFGFNK